MGYLIGGRLVLAATHTVFDRRGGTVVRTATDRKLAAVAVLPAGEETFQVDLMLLQITRLGFDEDLTRLGFDEGPPPIRFARVNPEDPTPVPNCRAVGFPGINGYGRCLQYASRQDIWRISGRILPGVN
jgi:hypothetical protein